MVVTLTEVMPAKVRATGFALAYSIAQAIFGGFTPAICTWLISASGDKAIPGLWLSASALVGLAGVYGVRRFGLLRRAEQIRTGMSEDAPVSTS